MTPDTNTTIVVVRHGNTFNSGDVILRVGGATDIPLTETGIHQGEAVGRALAELGRTPARIFCAPLLRTRQSADGIIKAFTPAPELEIAEFLTELNYGIDDGKPEDDVVLRLGILEKRDDIRLTTTVDELRQAGKAALKRWDNEAVLPLGWYHLEPAAAKLGAAWKAFGERAAREFSGRLVVAVTSNGIARFSKSLLPAHEAPPENLKLATGAFGVYQFDGKEWHCTRWNVRPALS